MPNTYNEAWATYNDPLVLYNGIALGPAATLIVAGADVTGELARNSLRVRQATHGNSLGTLDARLNDPARLPVTEDTVDLYVGLVRRYRGAVRATNAEAWTRPAGDYLFANFGAQDDGPDGVLPTTAPFDLSDTPNGTTTHGYQGISRATRTTEGGSPLTTYAVTTRETGLWAGQNVELTSAVYGLSAQEFTIREVSVSWPQPNAPTYQLVLGDPLVRLQQLVTEPNLPDDYITETHISDGAISTPKLAAEAVIARVANIGGTVVIGPDGIAMSAGQIGVSDNVTVDDDGLLVTDDALVERVRAGALGGGDYGLRVVSDDGVTVLVDGHSTMYRVDASITVSNIIGAATDPTVVNAWTDVNIGGTYTNTPAHLSHIATTTGNGAPRTIGRLVSWAPMSAPLRMVAMTVMDVTTLLSGDDCLVRFGGHNAQGSAQTWYAKVDVLSTRAT